ncbi:MAG: alanine racemase [Clostridia bacterium]|nr:alanine racemase [Clostridia bacterium]
MYTTNFSRRSWVEINLDQLRRNLALYEERLPEGARVIAVVKADAYGHGDARVALELNRLGVDLFAVSNIDEAITLREAGTEGEILILGYTPPELYGKLLEYDITQTLVSEEYAESLLSLSSDVKCQFAIDTGMNRIGLCADDAEACARTVEKYYSRCNLNGIFTHLSCADGVSEDDREYTEAQLYRFERVAERLERLDLPYVHCLNSAGGLYYADECKYGGFVRLGIVLYGLKPDRSSELPEGIRPILTWKTVVSVVKDLKSGEAVGYGRAFYADRDMRIATLPTGYADGYSRRLSESGAVYIQGKRAPIVGRICMDQMMVDVSDISDVREGDEVILIGDEYTADDMARDLDTIGYEVVCGISKRVARIYKK